MDQQNATGDIPPPSEAEHLAWLNKANVLQFIRRLGPAGPLAVIAASVPGLGGIVLVSLSPWFAPWLREHHGLGVFVYIFGFVILGGLALLPSWTHAVLGGWAFGFAIGFPAALTAFIGASALTYIFGRFLSGERVIGLIEEHPKSKAVYDALLGRRFGKTLLIVTLLRTPPSSPFAIVNLAMGAARVNAAAFVLGTLAGLTPRTAAVVFIAAGVSELNFKQPTHLWMWIAGFVLTVAVLGVIGYMANQALAGITSQKPVTQANNPE